MYFWIINTNDEWYFSLKLRIILCLFLCVSVINQEPGLGSAIVYSRTGALHSVCWLNHLFGHFYTFSANNRKKKKKRKKRTIQIKKRSNSVYVLLLNAGWHPAQYYLFVFWLCLMTLTFCLMSFWLVSFDLCRSIRLIFPQLFPTLQARSPKK